MPSAAARAGAPSPPPSTAAPPPARSSSPRPGPAPRRAGVRAAAGPAAAAIRAPRRRLARRTSPKTPLPAVTSWTIERTRTGRSFTNSPAAAGWRRIAGDRVACATSERSRDRSGNVIDEGAASWPTEARCSARAAVPSRPAQRGREAPSSRTRRSCWPRCSPPDASALERAGTEVHAVGPRQPGRDGAALGPAQRASPLGPGAQLAGPPRGGRDPRAGATGAERLTELTGLPLDPYFAAPKMTWLRRSEGSRGVDHDDRRVAQPAPGRRLRDRRGDGVAHPAARPARPRHWSPEACAAFGLDAELQPQIVDCAAPVGETSAFGRAAPADRPGRGSAGGAARAVVLRSRGGEVHVRHRRLHPRQRRRAAAALGRSGLAACVAWRLRGASHLLPRRPGPQRRIGASTGSTRVGLIGDRRRARPAAPTRRSRRRCHAAPPPPSSTTTRLAGLGVAPFWAPDGARRLARPLARHRTAGPGARARSGDRGAGGAAWRRRSPRDTGVPLAAAARRRRADAFGEADADAGRPAAGPRRVLPVPRRDRAGSGRARAARSGRGRAPPRRPSGAGRRRPCTSRG